MRTRRGLPVVAAALAAVALFAAGCGTPNPAAQTRLDGHVTGHTTGHTTGPDPTPGSTAIAHAAKPVAPARPAALRRGETMRTVTSPVSYSPKAPTTGT